jgi:hypothetical protein
MSKIIRVIIVVAALVLVALVSSQVAQAGWAPGDNASKEAQKDAQLPKQEDIQVSEPSDTQPQSMGQEGTIRPPGCEGMTIIESGQYSLCGVAIINAELKDDGVEIVLTIAPLPTDAGRVLAGTVNLECWVDGEIHQGPHDEHAEPRLCFAAPPDKDVQVRFYDESTKAWVAVETTVADGQACAPANRSGKYILVEK